MKAHDLARKLLDGPDYDVTLSIACGKDTISTFVEDEEGRDAEFDQEIKVDGGTIPNIDIEQEGERIDLSVFMWNCRFGWLD